MNISELRIPAAVFVGEVRKIVRGWDIAIEPKDFTEHPERYDSVTIAVSNKDTGISRKTSIPLIYTVSPPTHFTVLISNIAALVCRKTKEDDSALTQKIHNQFTEYFESQKR